MLSYGPTASIVAILALARPAIVRATRELGLAPPGLGRGRPEFADRPQERSAFD